MMTILYRWTLFWAPRVLSIAYIAFLSMFALGVFGKEHGFWRILLALTMHLIPTFVLIVALLLAWRWEWVGAILYAGAGMLYVIWGATAPTFRCDKTELDSCDSRACSCSRRTVSC
jgi:hypothetical protein